MHEIRSSVLAEGLRGDSPLLSKKAKLPRGRAGQHPEEGEAASLMTVPIPRFESRHSNHRSEERQPNVVESARLTIGEAGYDVRVANVSSKGAMVDTCAELLIGERVEIAFPDCNRLRGNVRWVKDGRAGIEFQEQTEIIASASVREAVRRPFLGLVSTEDVGEEPGCRRERAARIGLIWSGLLQAGDVEASVRLRNISCGGAMLECAQDLPIGARVRLDLADAGLVDAEVRWSLGGQIGISFDETFDVQRLARARPAGFVSEAAEQDDEEQ
mgnify:CR=1 FL=1